LQCFFRFRVCPIKMSCSLINWFWMFLLSHYVCNYLPINFLSIYLPWYIRHNEFQNFKNTGYLVKQMPNLSMWLNISESIHLHNSIEVLHLNNWARCWVETELGFTCWLYPFITFITLSNGRKTFEIKLWLFLKTNYPCAVLEYHSGLIGSNYIIGPGALKKETNHDFYTSL
jgi:hypothetical protein